jgi:hypothetical protein
LLDSLRGIHGFCVILIELVFQIPHTALEPVNIIAHAAKPGMIHPGHEKGYENKQTNDEKKQFHNTYSIILLNGRVS